MRTSWPTARTALPVPQVCASPIDALAPGLQLLGGLDPADPFVAGQRGDILPGRQGFEINFQRFFQIFGKIVDDAAGYVFLVSHHNSNGRGGRKADLTVRILRRLDNAR